MTAKVLSLPWQQNETPSALEHLDPTLDLVLRRVRLRALRRAAWLRKLWAEEGESGGKLAVTHAEMDTHLAGLDSPEAEADWLATEPNVTAWNHELKEVEAALTADSESRLAQIQRIFSLSVEDIDIFQACLAQALDPSLARVYAYLHDHASRAYVSEELVARLFGHGRSGVWQATSPLARWELVQAREVAPGEPLLLACDPMLRDWLQGRQSLDPYLVGVATILPPLEALQDWPVEETVAFIKHLAYGETAGRVRVHVVGPPGSGRRTLAAAIAARLGLVLLAIDSDRVELEHWPRVYLRAQRQAYLDGVALAWSGEAVIQRPWPQKVASFPIQFLILEPGQVARYQPDLIEQHLEVPPLSLDERRQLWRHYVPSSAAWPHEAFEALVQRFRITVGEITAVARKEPAGPGQAAVLVREAARERLGKLAQLIECPFTWDDLVVPEHLRGILEDLVFEAGERVAFWERPEARRLFPQGRGLLALFSGPSGTGKTMAAQVIAASLGLDLFRIDLAAVVSKYVGETSQNLERILSRAQHMDVVLLFDEADALFGKRTEIKDAHDRFANTDTNYLLQAIEDYRGVALLSTNKKDNIDTAFLRRIRYILDFPKPDAERRLLIWRRLVSELTGVERLKAVDENGRTLGQTLEALATLVELTGAQIKYAVLAAIFAAKRDDQPPGLKHLLRGVDRELMKEGRTLSERERRRLNEHGG